MKMGRIAFVTLVATSLSSFVHADFKYTQQSKMTGGTLMTMTKTLGVFSKGMRQATEPQNSTITVKGNRLRDEHAQGMVEIIDLDQRRFIYIDSAKKTYSIVTFDEFKAAMMRARAKAEQEEAKNRDKDVKITPKFDATATGATRSILGMKANEMKMKMEMLVEASDPKAKEKAQSGTFVMNSDAWIAPSVPGYEEVQNFYLRMGKELDWLPNALGGMGMMNPQMGPAMAEFRKNAEKVKGMPLLQFVSIGATGSNKPGQDGEQEEQARQEREERQAEENSAPTNTTQAVMKGLGGMFGRKKKKEQEQQQQQEQQQAAQQSTPAASQPQPSRPANPNSLMEMTVEVTSVANSPADPALFEIPAGYTQVKRNPDDAFGGKR